MPVFQTPAKDLINHISALGITAGDNVCVHSRLLSFGRIEGGVDQLAKVLMDAVGPRGTIAVPTFTFNVTPQDVYDAVATQPFMVGPLSDTIWRIPHARRTGCPVHSFAAVGRASDVLMRADPCCSIGPGSAFAIMADEGFKLLLLGCTYQEGATHVHHVEAEFGVPYRNWIEFPRQVRQSNGQIDTIYVRYYAKVANAPTNDLSGVERAIEKAGHGVFIRLPNGKRRSHCISIDVLEREIRSLIHRNPYALVAAREAPK